MMEISKTRTAFMGIVFAAAYIGWGLLLSLQPPFYPSEAEKRGATPSQYGFVFGIANLAALIFAPIFGAFGTQIGPKWLYNLGAFIQGICGISFGFLVYVQGVAPFLGLSYLLRFLDGVADAASWAASVSILMKIFPKKVSTIMSWSEMLFGLGYMLGPALGSYLYEIGGFLLPFEVVGCWCLMCAFGILFIIPNVKMKTFEETDGVTSKKLTMKDLMRYPSIFMPFIDNFICFAGNGMIESMLEPHLKSSGATQSQVGTTFLILGGVYAVTTPFVGYVCDKIPYPIFVSIFGNTCMAIAFTFIGPLPFINIAPTVSSIQGSIAVVGFGYALVMVSTFGRAQAAAISKGFNDDMDTYILIAGMWSCTFYLGNFLGPTLAGLAVEKYGFRATTIGFFALDSGIILVDLFELYFSFKRSKEKDYEQLE